jgi:hypothetical protein
MQGCHDEMNALHAVLILRKFSINTNKKGFLYKFSHSKILGCDNDNKIIFEVTSSKHNLDHHYCKSIAS